MISLDQVFLLEQKVESAVAKIQQLQAENDALRTKCDQLTNALSAKSEQLSSFENDQNQIEDKIKKALDRLNSIENSVLKTCSQQNTNVQAKPVEPVVNIQKQPVPAQQVPVQNIQQQTQINAEINSTIEKSSPSFDTMETANIPQESSVNDSPSFEESTPDFNSQAVSFDDMSVEEQFDEGQSEEDNTDGLGFDIF